MQNALHTPLFLLPTASFLVIVTQSVLIDREPYLLRLSLGENDLLECVQLFMRTQVIRS